MRIERQVLFWLAAGVVLVLAIGLLRPILLPFVVGLAIAYFLNPVVDGLTSRGLLGRTAASAVVVGASALVIGALLVFVVPFLLDQAQQLALGLPAEIERLSTIIREWARTHLGSRFPEAEAAVAKASQSLSDNWAGVAAWTATSLWSGSRAVFNFLSLLLVTPLVVFYMLDRWHPMIEKIDGWLPREHASEIRRLAGDINDAVSAFIRGQGVVCLLLAAYYAMLLGALGLNYGVLVGLATGLLSFVPFVGWALGFLTATGLALVQHWPDLSPVLLVVGVFVGGQAIDAAFLSPQIVGSKIGLNPVWLIFALFAFSYLFGFVGTLVAVPLAAAVGVLVRFGLEKYLQSTVYHGGARGEAQQEGLGGGGAP